MDQKEKLQVILRFSRRYGLSSLTHPPQYQSHVTDHSGNSRCVISKPPSCLLERPPSCLFDRLPDCILHDILSRLPIPELLTAQQSCVAWRRIVSSCPIFQRLYDQTNQQTWIALAMSSNFGHIPDGFDNFVLFNTNNNDGLYYFISLDQHLAASIATSWFLQGAADGLILLASREGRLVVVNLLTRRFRQLPDAKISSRLRLESCLKKNLEHPHDPPSISINIVVDSASRTFKVTVLGEVRIRQVHALIYSSLTNTWIIKLCPEIDHKLFRRFFHASVDGNTIYCASIYPLTMNSFSNIYPRWLVSYNTETHGSVVQEMPLMNLSAMQDTARFQRVQSIGIVNYKSRLFLLGAIAGYHGNPLWIPFTVVALWEANPSAGEWKLLTTTPFEWVSRYGIDFWSCELAAAYDGELSVTIIARSGSIKPISIELNLDTKEWKMLWNDNIATEFIDSPSLRSGSNKNKGLKAFHIKLKFCTVV